MKSDRGVYDRLTAQFPWMMTEEQLEIFNSYWFDRKIIDIEILIKIHRSLIDWIRENSNG